MEFGHLTLAELEQVRFSLPEDSPLTKRVLSSSATTQPGLCYVGCAKWGRKEWVGKIYPAGTKEINFLDHYVHHFNSIELNATHYQVYPAETISKWAAKADTVDFRFCPKVPQTISHYSNLGLAQARQLTDKFLEGILAFKDHLGPIFLQLSDKYSPAKKADLFYYLESLPRDLAFFVEVRHPGWYNDTAVRQEFFDTLSQLKIGAVITDTAGRRDCVHMELPIPKAFIRFVGNNLHKTDYQRIDGWITRIDQWLKNGLQELYFFMHNPDETFSPELCAYVVEEMNKHCHTSLVKPVFIDKGK